MKLAVRNMVCPRCVMVVENILAAQGYGSANVGLGFVDIADDISADDLDRISSQLHEVGFEVERIQGDGLIDSIKMAVIEHARSETGARLKLSAVLEEKCRQSYKSLAKLFSQSQGCTIENFYIAQRIEYVKELIDCGTLSLAEIAYRAGYSSVAYLSRQFSREVGLTISEYRSRK